MSTAVKTAREWVESMVKRETRGPGDTINALRRLSTKYGVPYSLLWSIKYRPPKDLYVEMFRKLEAAYDAELKKQQYLLDRERKLYEARTALGKSLVGFANSLHSKET